jgi:two-component sensor histidine kinase
MTEAQTTPSPRYRGVPLSTELVLGSLVVVVLALVAAGIALFAAGEEAIRREAQREAELAALAVLEASVAAPESDLGKHIARALLDQTASIIGIRVAMGDRDVFQLPPAAFVEATKETDRVVVVSVDHDGDARVTVRMDLDLAAPNRQRLTVLVLLTIAGSIVGAAVLLMFLMHHRVAKPLATLRTQVLNPDQRTSGLPNELQSLSDVLTEQASASHAELHRLERTEIELQQANSLHRLMLRELDHRVRNNLAALAALVDLERYASADVETFAERLGARLQSMRQVQDLLSESRDHAVEIGSLVQALLPDDVAQRVQRSGPAVEVSGPQAVPFGMAIHELLTNAMRHGSLSSAKGIVEVVWSTPRTQADGRRVLQLDWTETGGPQPKSHPSSRSGTGILTGLVESELGGNVDLRYPQTGALHRLVLRLRPLEHAGEV